MEQWFQWQDGRHGTVVLVVGWKTWNSGRMEDMEQQFLVVGWKTWNSGRMEGMEQWFQWKDGRHGTVVMNEVMANGDKKIKDIGHSLL